VAYDEIRVDIVQLVEEFKKSGPFKTDISLHQALEYIASVRNRLTLIDAKEEHIRQDLSFFHVDPTRIKELSFIRQVFSAFWLAC
jgi:hypothetical protein